MSGETSTPLPLTYAPADLSDLELASELYDATAVLGMGAEAGIAAHLAAELHERRTQAAQELLRRWQARP
jgi:hypothetical protein